MPKEPFPYEEGVRRIRLRQLFTARYPHKPTKNEVLDFCGWLAGHYPHLLPREKQGDPYQNLQWELNGLYD